MHLPVVFWRNRSVNLVSFGLFASVGSMLGTLVSFYYLFANGVDISQVGWQIALTTTGFNLLFAKLFVGYSVGMKSYLKDITHNLNQTSFHQQGGVIGFILSIILLHYWLGIPVTLLGDTACLGGILIVAIGRIGCFNYGCCTGIVAHGSTGRPYTDPEARICRDHPELLNTPLIPVQLYAAAIDIFIFGLCCLAWLFFHYSGLIMTVFFVGLNLKRIAIQPYRFKSSSNKLPYRWVAFGLILFFAAASLFFNYSGEQFFAPMPPALFSGPLFGQFLLDSPVPLSAIFVTGVINFLAYGIHGRRLGTHFNLNTEHS
jgi:hypothetical protein